MQYFQKKQTFIHWLVLKATHYSVIRCTFQNPTFILDLNYSEWTISNFEYYQRVTSFCGKIKSDSRYTCIHTQYISLAILYTSLLMVKGLCRRALGYTQSKLKILASPTVIKWFWNRILFFLRNRWLMEVGKSFAQS